MVFSFLPKILEMFLFITIPQASEGAFLSKIPPFHLAVVVLETGLSRIRQLFLSPNLIRIKFYITRILCWFLDFFTSSTNVYLQLLFSREETSRNGSSHSGQASLCPLCTAGGWSLMSTWAKGSFQSFMRPHELSSALRTKYQWCFTTPIFPSLIQRNCKLSEEWD